VANKEHFEIVSAGRDAITGWRRDHPDGCFDLAGAAFYSATLDGADLSRANLKGANLGSADLSRANLKRANLGGARLNDADLRYAILNGAELKGAELDGTDLSEANLSVANLSSAHLLHTRLIGTVLLGTNFQDTRWRYCVVADVDLSTTKGLECARHEGPSSVGLDTILRSRGNLPMAFLRDCGVPENILAYIPSLVGQVFDFYSCFISYSSKDDEFAKRLHARLQQEKLRVWFAVEDIKGGRKLYDQIDTAIRVHDKLLLALSQASMASEWVRTEIRRARKAEQDQGRQKLFPIRLCDMDALRRWECFDVDTGKDLAVEVREYHVPDFSNWKDHDSFEAAFTKLLRDLRKDELGPRRVAEGG
jgi:TIR domain/Pentapeptide repeats (8 copies)